MVVYKNKWSNRPKRYTYCNMGTNYSFDPTKKASLNGKLSNLLDYHISEAKFRNRKDVFILTDTGEVLDIS